MVHKVIIIMGPDVPKRVSCPGVILKSNKYRAQQNLPFKSLVNKKKYDTTYKQ